MPATRTAAHATAMIIQINIKYIDSNGQSGVARIRSLIRCTDIPMHRCLERQNDSATDKNIVVQA